MWIAVTRPVSASLARCELTHLAREPIDVARATAQHAAYEQALRSLGATLVRVSPAPELPDAVFVEDTAVVLDEVAVVTRPGAPSRAAETPAVASVLAAYRTVCSMEAPATLDGGDVLRLGRTLHVGRSSHPHHTHHTHHPLHTNRTNQAGIDQLERFVAPFGYQVVPVEFTGCLHLKSAVTALADDLLLLNPAWVSASSFPGREAVLVDDREPHGANALRFAGTILYPSHCPRTCDRLVDRDLHVVVTDCSELAKAEGAVTCCSLIFEASPSAE